MPNAAAAGAPDDVALPAATAIADPARKALGAFSRRDYAQANRQFSIALAQDPRNAGLNGLNALAYHQRFQAGERDLFGLAEAGYRAALDQREDSVVLSTQLASLYMAAERPDLAVRVAAHAVDVDPDSAPALKSLARAAYYVAEPALALWAMEEAGRRTPGDRELQSMRPLVYAAAGLPDRAGAALDAASASGVIADEQRGRTRRRLEALSGAWREAQLATSTLPAAATPTPAGPPGIPIDLNAVAPIGAVAPAADQGAVAYAWWDCQQQLVQNLNITASGVGGYGAYGSADETTPLPALPAPCKGQALPRMAMIDAVILRTEDVRTTAHGLNLLDGLSIFVSESISLQKVVTNGVPSRQRTISQALSLGGGPGAGLAYALNVANASTRRADVLARPSLLALDRQPAQFFSGSTVSVALVSPQSGGGNIEDKPVGVSLSVTPTFVDDETMLISVKAARSFFEETATSATFQQSVQTSRNMVTANVLLRFDQTLILSGLSEREATSADSRTPVLGQTPVIQYLFGRRDSREIDRAVVIMLTPRRAEGARAELEPQVLRDARARADASLRALGPNLPVVLAQMQRNRLLRPRRGEIDGQTTEDPNTLDQIVRDLGGLIHY